MKSLLNTVKDMVWEQFRKQYMENIHSQDAFIRKDKGRLSSHTKALFEHPDTYNHEDAMIDKSYCEGNPYTEEEL